MSSAILGESIDTINVAEKILLRQSQLRITIKTVVHRLMAMMITFGFGYYFFRKNFTYIVYIRISKRVKHRKTQKTLIVCTKKKITTC